MKGNLQSYAMQYGTYMGLFWIVKFIFFPLGLAQSVLFFLFIGLTLCVPFVGYRFARLYRDGACEGSIGFVKAWVFTFFLYMFAALLTSMAHYVYFRYIDQGFVFETYEALVRDYRAQDLPGMEPYVEQLDSMLTVMRSLTPISITMQLLTQNVFYGMLLALPTALFVRRRPKRTDL